VSPAAKRLLKHPRLMPYHRLIAAVVLVNAGARTTSLAATGGSATAARSRRSRG